MPVEHATDRLLDPDRLEPEVVLVEKEESLGELALPAEHVGSDEDTDLDPLRLYLDRTAHEPLLGREQEVKLAACIEEADRARRVVALRSPLGVEWLTELAARVRAGLVGPLERCGEDAERGGLSADPAWFRRRLPAQLARVLQLVRDANALARPRPRGLRIEPARARGVRRTRVEAQLEEAVVRLRLAPEHVDRLVARLRRTVREATDGARRLAPFERRLAEIELRGAAARQRLLEANLRLVIWVARRYAHRGLPLLDLIQEGNIGLIRAIGKFDHRRGYRFSTYATWWIRQAISRALADQTRTIRVPVYLVEMMGSIARVTRAVAQDVDREPTAEEVAARLEWPVDAVRDCLRLAREPISLDEPDDDGSSVTETLEDETSPQPVEFAVAGDRRRQIERVLATLPPREAQVLRLRFGIDDRSERTLEDIGTHLRVTRERVRQIEAAALRKLRRGVRARMLRPFVEG